MTTKPASTFLEYAIMRTIQDDPAKVVADMIKLMRRQKELEVTVQELRSRLAKPTRKRLPTRCEFLKRLERFPERAPKP